MASLGSSSGDLVEMMQTLWYHSCGHRPAVHHAEHLDWKHGDFFTCIQRKGGTGSKREREREAGRQRQMNGRCGERLRWTDEDSGRFSQEDEERETGRQTEWLRKRETETEKKTMGELNRKTKRQTETGRERMADRERNSDR